MEALHASLLALQELDDEMVRAETRLQEFDGRLAEADAPLTQFERDVESTRVRVAELREEATRLGKAAEQKRGRLKQYEERLMRVRNVREESAARAEMDLVRGAVEADVEEHAQVSEQLTRTDLKLDDMEKQLVKLRAELAPKREALLEERALLEQQLATLRNRREIQAKELDTPSRRLYERVRGARARRVLAPLTDEGACGNCFNVLPLQEQADVRRGQQLQRCEACGVILYVA